MKTKAVQKLTITSHNIEIINNPEGRMVARCSITLNDCIQVNGLRINSGDTGYALQWAIDPTLNHGDYMRICHPINRSFGEEVSSLLISAYIHMIQDSETKTLIAEMQSIIQQRDKARTDGRKVLADALDISIAKLNEEIQNN